ncbi:MAG: long-chain fatty acid--CoA ligase [Cyclobacteriaceae bacterium]|jgi:long-chain acyl-CoA synthetase
MNFLSAIVDFAENRYDGEALHFKPSGSLLWSSLSWQKFAEMTRKTSAALMHLGVKREDNVAIYAQNMPEWTISDLGIMCSNAVSVPIYATNTSDQAKYIIDEAEVRILFVGEEEQYRKALEIYSRDDSTLEKIIVYERNVDINSPCAMYFDDFLKLGDGISHEKIKEVAAGISEDDLATIIYTSGTTGVPKGVMLTHKNFNVTARIHDLRLKIDQNNHSLAFLPLSHIFERAWSLYALYKGVGVSYLSDPKQIIETLKEVRPTMMCSVPRLYQKAYHTILAKIESSSKLKKALFNAAYKAGEKIAEHKRTNTDIPFLLKIKHGVLDTIVLKKIRKAFGGRLKFMPCAGAPLSAEITSFFHTIGMPVLIGYGLTETTATVTVFPDSGYEFGTVGLSMPEVRVKIGPNDEIWVQGDTVMKGYYKKPEETAKVMQDGWLKTGDAGSINESGILTITDRIKDLMKTSGGKYVAPQPVESLLTNDNFIENAILIGDDKPYVTALLVPNFEALKEYAHSINLKYHDLEELIKKSGIIEFYEEKIERLQKSLANFEKVKKFRLLPHDFNMQLGELTPTLKIRREMILKNFTPLIEEMYTF